jgi:MSHA biogenesis protein MshJ
MKQEMKQHWQKLAARIDALSLRERVFVFLSVIICCLALADAVWLSPTQAAYKQATQRFTAQSAEVKRLRDELGVLAQPVDASKVVRDDIAAAQARLEQVNQEIKAVAPLAEGGPAIEQALVQFLRRQEGLTLISTGTLKHEAPKPNPGAKANANAGSAADSQPVLSRRGLELKVAGSYAELARYVKTLENALPTLRWGSLQLTAGKKTPELTLQVYVVGVPQ